MDWKTIPAAPAYEINRRGQVRRRDTRYRIAARRHRVQLWLAPGYLTVNPRALAAELFAAPEPIESAQAAPEPQEAAVAEPEPVNTAPADTKPVEADQAAPDVPEKQAEPDTATPATSRGRDWRPCVGVPGYEINRRGDVRSAIACRILPQRYQGDHPVPYVYVTVRGNGTARKIHVMLEETFGPGAAAAAGYPTPDLAQVSGIRDAARLRQERGGNRHCHDCGKPTYNYRCNRCWKRLRGYAVGEESAAEEACDAHDAL